MNASDAPVGGHSAGLSRWLFLLVPALALLMVIIWWALGLRTLPRTEGFGSRLVSFDFADTSLTDALAVLRPGTPCEYESELGFTVTLKVKSMSEDQAVYWISQLVDQHIELRDGVIHVRGDSWFERSYQVTSEWSRRVLGISFWPNR